MNPLYAETEFGLNILRQLDPNESAVFSPFSIRYALALVYSASEGETRDEISKVLCEEKAFDTQSEELRMPRSITEVYKDRFLGLEVYEGDTLFYLTDAYQKIMKDRESLSLANRMYLSQDYYIFPAYQQEVQESYDSTAELLNMDDSKKAAKIVNHYVEKATCGKIKEIITKDLFSSKLSGIIVNAISFHDKWNLQFSECLTRIREFYTDEGSYKMPFLHGRFEHKYLETPDFQMVSLPYHGKHFQFIVLLPKEKLGLDDIIENLRARQLHKWFNSMAYESVKIYLPKIKLETGIKLNYFLQNMGVNSIFHTATADMSNATRGKHAHINKAVHKAVFEVTEEGTTPVTVAKHAEAKKSIAGQMEPKSIPFRADHPFLFFVTCRPQKYHYHIVFMGTMRGQTLEPTPPPVDKRKQSLIQATTGHPVINKTSKNPCIVQ